MTSEQRHHRFAEPLKVLHQSVRDQQIIHYSHRTMTRPKRICRLMPRSQVILGPWGVIVMQWAADVLEKKSRGARCHGQEINGSAGEDNNILRGLGFTDVPFSEF